MQAAKHYATSDFSSTRPPSIVNLCKNVKKRDHATPATKQSSGARERRDPEKNVIIAIRNNSPPPWWQVAGLGVVVVVAGLVAGGWLVAGLEAGGWLVAGWWLAVVQRVRCG